MASASVSVAGNLPLLACLGSVGRFRANGPVAAHPNRRMHQIPFRVVPELHCDAEKYVSVMVRRVHLDPVSYGISYFPGRAAKRLWRKAIWAGSDCWHGSSSADSKDAIWSSGRTSKKDFSKTMVSRRHVFKSKCPS